MRCLIAARAGRIATCGVVVTFLAASTACLRGADDGPAAGAAPTDIDAGRPVTTPTDDDAAELQTLAAETIALMQRAQAEFAAGRLADPTAGQQSEIAERLQRLAELAELQSASASSSRRESAAGGASPATNSGDGEGAASRGLDAAESSESAAGDAATGSAKSARDLATSVWGHLPARQRDRMQSRFSERFLPQYDRLVRQYYEALATEGLSDE